MPTIFHRAKQGWAALPVPALRTVLHLAPVGLAVSDDPECMPPGSVALVRADTDRAWAAIAPEGGQLLHNGVPVTAGLRVLLDRDSLALEGGETVFFSTEEAARVEPFAGPAEKTCPRCRTDILPGKPAVKCPNCGAFHHEMEDRLCWTYSERCSLCPQPTALDTGPQWTPEAL